MKKPKRLKAKRLKRSTVINSIPAPLMVLLSILVIIGKVYTGSGQANFGGQKALDSELRLTGSYIPNNTTSDIDDSVASVSPGITIPLDTLIILSAAGLNLFIRGVNIWYALNKPKTPKVKQAKKEAQEAKPLPPQTSVKNALIPEGTLFSDTNSLSSIPTTLNGKDDLEKQIVQEGKKKEEDDEEEEEELSHEQIAILDEKKTWSEKRLKTFNFLYGTFYTLCIMSLGFSAYNSYFFGETLTETKIAPLLSVNIPTATENVWSAFCSFANAISTLTFNMPPQVKSGLIFAYFLARTDLTREQKKAILREYRFTIAVCILIALGDTAFAIMSTGASNDGVLGIVLSALSGISVCATSLLSNIPSTQINTNKNKHTFGVLKKVSIDEDKTRQYISTLPASILFLRVDHKLFIRCKQNNFAREKLISPDDLTKFDEFLKLNNFADNDYKEFTAAEAKEIADILGIIIHSKTPLEKIMTSLSKLSWRGKLYVVGSLLSGLGDSIFTARSYALSVVRLFLPVLSMSLVFSENDWNPATIIWFGFTLLTALICLIDKGLTNLFFSVIDGTLSQLRKMYPDVYPMPEKEIIIEEKPKPQEPDVTTIAISAPTHTESTRETHSLEEQKIDVSRPPNNISAVYVSKRLTASSPSPNGLSTADIAHFERLDEEVKNELKSTLEEGKTLPQKRVIYASQSVRIPRPVRAADVLLPRVPRSDSTTLFKPVTPGFKELLASLTQKPAEFHRLQKTEDRFKENFIMSNP